MARAKLIAPGRTTLPEIVFRTRLDDIIFAFRMIYSYRFGYWSLSLSSENDTPIVEGIRVRVGEDLLAPFNATALPSGKLLCESVDNSSEDPGREAWSGGTYRLVYEV